MRLFRRIFRRAHRELRKIVDRRSDRRASSYAAAEALPEGLLATHFMLPDLDGLPEALIDLAPHYLAHRFDILGSGWARNGYGVECRGVEGHRYDGGGEAVPDKAGRWLAGRINPANLATAQAAWRLVDEDYSPIDWQRDIKSGFRWSETCWYRDIAIGAAPGADIKVPWELARMHHLPQLALAGAMLGGPESHAREFRNELLDFIATNPPRFGANWACAMDVAIRLVNWLIARDIFHASGVGFDEAFEALLKRSVYEHGCHIAANLERVEGHSGNHYLADIVGLLFAAAYLPRSTETDAWFAFAARELAAEADRQFNADGSNFEASTAYHRLSLELWVYGMALLFGLPDDGHPVDRRAFDLAKIHRAALFVTDITRPDRHIVQVGDTDSGRLLKLLPAIERMTVGQAKQRFANLTDYSELGDGYEYLLEDHLDHRHVVAAANAFCHSAELADFSRGWHWETRWLQGRIGTLAAPVAPMDPVSFSGLPDADGVPAAGQDYRFELPCGGLPASHGLKLSAYPDFGLYIYRSERIYLAIRCGPIGLNGLGAHAHNDPLSVELWIDDAPVTVDPGTYLYTPMPSQRDRFRSVKAHFAPRLMDVEPGDMRLGVFRLGDEAQARCLRFDPMAFEGCYRAGSGKVFRRVEIQDRAILVFDRTDSVLPLARLEPRLFPYSPGYGWITGG